MSICKFKFFFRGLYPGPLLIREREKGGEEKGSERKGERRGGRRVGDGGYKGRGGGEGMG
jgi:hypothetical protein